MYDYFPFNSPLKPLNYASVCISFPPPPPGCYLIILSIVYQLPCIFSSFSLHTYQITLKIAKYELCINSTLVQKENESVISKMENYLKFPSCVIYVTASISSYLYRCCFRWDEPQIIFTSSVHPGNFSFLPFSRILAENGLWR